MSYVYLYWIACSEVAYGYICSFHVKFSYHSILFSPVVLALITF